MTQQPNPIHANKPVGEGCLGGSVDTGSGGTGISSLPALPASRALLLIIAGCMVIIFLMRRVDCLGLKTSDTTILCA